jgi:steroid delta-isomerase-like uncharacterized protein
MTTTQLIATYYDTFNRGAREEMLALLSEDVAHDVNQTGRETGRAAFRQFLGRMDASYAERVEDLVVMANEDGSRAAAEFFIRGKYLKTDSGLPEARRQEYHLRVGAFFEIAEGKISRVTNYYDLQNWIRQVSVSA